jgi:hypothetical protein
MITEPEDIAGLLRNEARIARAGDWPHPTCPDLLDRAADEIERLRWEISTLRAAAGEHLGSVERAYEFASLACDLLGVDDAKMPWNSWDREGCWQTFDTLNDRLTALVAPGAADAK